MLYAHEANELAAVQLFNCEVRETKFFEMILVDPDIGRRVGFRNQTRKVTHHLGVLAHLNERNNVALDPVPKSQPRRFQNERVNDLQPTQLRG